MYFISSDTDDPCFNLALEEYLLRNSVEEFFILSTNRASVISGKHQCVHREVNTRFTTENNIPVLRRITGGGTVFHDSGNLNFCFIRNCESGKQVDFPRYILPMVYFLKSIGIPAYLEGSDIKTDGLKISGNAEHVYRNRVLHHGTLLWNASLDTLRNCIRKDTSAYVTRAVASKPSPVTNLSGKVSGISDIIEFSEALVAHFKKTAPVEVYEIAAGIKVEIEAISHKYHTWEWNYAYGPEYEFSSEFCFKGKQGKCVLSVREGLIVNCSIDGDNELAQKCKKLAGLRHMPEDIGRILKSEHPELDVYDLF